MPRPKDPYKILDVERNATHDEIRKAYVKLARKYHPDMHPPGAAYAEEMFKEVSSAYQVLSDDSLRARYDQGPATTIRRPQTNTPREPVEIDPAILEMLQQHARSQYRRQLTPPSAEGVVGLGLWVAVLFLGVFFAVLMLAFNRFAAFILVVGIIGSLAGWLAGSIAAQYRKNAWLWFAIGAGTVIAAVVAVSIRLVHT